MRCLKVQRRFGIDGCGRLHTRCLGAGGGYVVIREYDRIRKPRIFPMMIVSDNSTERTSNAIMARLEKRPVLRHYIVPAEPQ